MDISTEDQIAHLVSRRDALETEVKSIDHELHVLLRIYSKEQGFMVPLSLERMRLTLAARMKEDG